MHPALGALSSDPRRGGKPAGEEKGQEQGGESRAYFSVQLMTNCAVVT